MIASAWDMSKEIFVAVMQMQDEFEEMSAEEVSVSITDEMNSVGDVVQRLVSFS